MTANSSDDKTLNIWEHVTELSKRLKIIIIAVLLSGALIGFWPADLRGFLDPFRLYQPLISVIMLRMRSDFLPTDAKLIAGGPVNTIFVFAYLSFLIGLVVSSPIVAYESYAFISPGLLPQERKFITGFMASFVGLFTLGIAMSYFLIIPLTFKILIWFIESGGALPLINISDFYSLILTIMLASGLFYTVPVFLVLLVQFGVLRASSISGKRKMIYLALWIVLVIVTPDPTPITGTLIILPFILVFEVGVLVAKRVDKGVRTTTLSATEKIVYLKCKYCGGLMQNPSGFCPACGKAQV